MSKIADAVDRSIICRCGRGVYEYKQILMALNQKASVTLGGVFVADCMTCGGRWLIETQDIGVIKYPIHSPEGRACIERQLRITTQSNDVALARTEKGTI